MNKWLKNKFVKTVLVMILSVPSLFAQNITLTAFDYPPYMDESLPNKGLFCELVAAAYKSVGYEVDFKFYPLKRSTIYVIQGEELAQLGTKWNFPKEARESAVQAIPLFYYRVVGFYLKDKQKDISFKTLKDLHGYRLGVIRGSSDAAIFELDSKLNVEEVNLMEQMFHKVYTNRNDIGFTVELSGLTYINKHYTAQKDRWVMTEDAIQGILADVVFSKKYPNAKMYMDAFAKGVEKIRNNGEYLRIFEKYYGVGKVPKVASDINKEPYVIPEE